MYYFPGGLQDLHKSLHDQKVEARRQAEQWANHLANGTGQVPGIQGKVSKKDMEIERAKYLAKASAFDMAARMVEDFIIQQDHDAQQAWEERIDAMLVNFKKGNEDDRHDLQDDLLEELSQATDEQIESIRTRALAAAGVSPVDPSYIAALGELFSLEAMTRKEKK